MSTASCSKLNNVISVYISLHLKPTYLGTPPELYSAAATQTQKALSMHTHKLRCWRDKRC